MAETSKRILGMALGLCVLLVWPDAAATAADEIDEERLALLEDHIKKLSDPNPEIRLLAVGRIRELGGMAVPPLMNVLKDNDPLKRVSALRALAEFGPRAR